MGDARTSFHRHQLPRRLLWLAVVVVVVTTAFVVGVGRRVHAEKGIGLAAGIAFVETVATRTAAAQRAHDVAFGDAVVLGYLERLRLGLGSPFRLAEYALRDPRLDSTARRRVAAALIARTLRGQAYAIEPAALAGLGPALSSEAPEAAPLRGVRHLALIEAAITRSPDPRVGELAVRLAYELAATDRTLERGAMAAIAPVAALVRDRHAAVADARRLLRAAWAERVDPLGLMVTWRRERRFAVERPATESIGETLELEAMARVPQLLDSVRAIVSNSAVASGDSLNLGAGRGTPALSGLAAARLASGIARYAPPQGPVVSAVRHYGAALLADRDSSSTDDRRDVVEGAMNEESLAAAMSQLASDRGADMPTARLLVAAATALRPYGQEMPWFPGDGGPSDDELRREFGVAAVRFDAGVPSRWRPYYRRMLADGLRDLRRVLPAVSLDGARVRFRSGPLGGATLAMHDPRSRTIHLPVATAAGALAHEVAHDLDWQLARRRYSRRGSYGTDVVVREQRGRLAASLRGLTSADLVPPAEANGGRPPDEVRPAEVFARTLDWFVSVALAREGRVNGYLSAVQDEVLSGHVAVLPRNVGGLSAQALADVLEEMTLVGAPLREWLLAQWGPARVRRPYTLAREVIATPIAANAESTLRGGDWMGSRSVYACRVSADGEAARGRAALAQLAAEARSRGALRARAQRYPSGARPPWAESLLGVGPWSPELGEAAVRRFAAIILFRLEKSGATGSALRWGDRIANDGRRGRGTSPLADGCGE